MSFPWKKVSQHLYSVLTETKRKEKKGEMLASIQSKSEDACGNSKIGSLKKN